jgi:hypothetical protein
VEKTTLLIKNQVIKLCANMMSKEASCLANEDQQQIRRKATTMMKDSQEENEEE